MAELADLQAEVVRRSLADAIERSTDEYATEDCTWFSFRQTFANTSFMGKGIGGQMMTSQQMVAVLLDDGMFVYCGGRFAYRCPRRAGMACVDRRNFPPYAPVGDEEEAPK